MRKSQSSLIFLVQCGLGLLESLSTQRPWEWQALTQSWEAGSRWASPSLWLACINGLLESFILDLLFFDCFFPWRLVGYKNLCDM